MSRVRESIMWFKQVYEEKKTNQRYVTLLSCCVGFLLSFVALGGLWIVLGKKMGHDFDLYTVANDPQGPKGFRTVLYDGTSGLISYYGQLTDALFHGTGATFHANGSLEYSGGWRQGKRDGLGTSFASDGSLLYHGHHRDGRKHGFGTEFVGGKLAYVGHFDDDLRQGHGESFVDKEHYNGSWKGGMRNGFGTYTTEDYTYKGDFKDDRKSGVGFIAFTNGAQYRGEFRNDMFEGRGCFFDNNQLYISSYKNHKRNGSGYKFYIDGTYASCTWSEGDRRSCQVHSSNQTCEIVYGNHGFKNCLPQRQVPKQRPADCKEFQMDDFLTYF